MLGVSCHSLFTHPANACPEPSCLGSTVGRFSPTTVLQLNRLSGRFWEVNTTSYLKRWSLGIPTFCFVMADKRVNFLLYIDKVQRCPSWRLFFDSVPATVVAAGGASIISIALPASVLCSASFPWQTFRPRSRPLARAWAALKRAPVAQSHTETLLASKVYTSGTSPRLALAGLSP